MHERSSLWHCAEAITNISILEVAWSIKLGRRNDRLVLACQMDGHEREGEDERDRDVSSEAQF
jgi:hypothetical protein